MDASINQFINYTRLKLIGQDKNNWKVQDILYPNPASVLIPITKINNELVILFTKRTGIVNNHQNQISFPGGRIEKNDQNSLSASLRETQEEIGICKEDIEILGDLQPRNTSTGFYIFPFVGFIHNISGIRLNPYEVEKILFIPIDWLQDPKNSNYELYQSKSTFQHTVLFYSNFKGEVVWGVTAAILKDFLCIIK